MDLSGRVAIITGSTRGIGNAIARRMAEAGAITVINGVSDQSVVEREAEKIRATGSDSLGVLADISSAEGAKKLVDTVIEKYGKIDILVNNAGINRDNLVVRMSDEDWDKVMAINLKSVFLCTRAVLRPMIKQHWGRIINMSSVVGVAGNAGQSNYAASKAGIIGFTKAIAREVGSRGITVNAIAPGFIETDMTGQMEQSQADQLKSRTSLNRLGTPQDIAEAAAFLASEEAGYITGHVLSIDGGMGGI